MSTAMRAIQCLISGLAVVLPLIIWRSEPVIACVISGIVFWAVVWPVRCLLIGHVFTVHGKFMQYDANGECHEKDCEHYWYCRRSGCNAVNPDTKSVTDQLK